MSSKGIEIEAIGINRTGGAEPGSVCFVSGDGLNALEIYPTHFMVSGIRVEPKTPDEAREIIKAFNLFLERAERVQRKILEEDA